MNACSMKLTVLLFNKFDFQDVPFLNYSQDTRLLHQIAMLYHSMYQVEVISLVGI